MNNAKPVNLATFDPLEGLPAHIPVNPILTDQMKVDVMVNKEGHIWVCHDRPFKEYVDWIEFDADAGRLIFVTQGGRLNDFGIQIKPLMAKYIKKADTADLLLMKNKKLHDFSRVAL
ncbi:MAG: hypothetical protein VXY16_02305, partial [Pseudomonadota bacterium]|nr:hypothetical protein [Pseudomonadota bacterium]